MKYSRARARAQSRGSGLRWIVGRVEAPAEGIFAIAMTLLAPKLRGILDRQRPARASGLLYSIETEMPGRSRAL